MGLRYNSEIYQSFFNFSKTLRASCWVSKIIASHTIWVHGLVSDSRKSKNNFEIWEWDKYPLKSFFSKTVYTIVISVPRSTSSPKIMMKNRKILVFSASWRSAILKVRNHELLKKNNVYILKWIFIFSILWNLMVSNFQ